MKQRTGQSAVDFMSAVEVEADRASIEGDQLRCVIVQGLLPNIHQFVATREENDVYSLRRWLTVADTAAVLHPKDEISSAMMDIQTEGNAGPRGVSVEWPGKRVTKEYVAVTDGMQGPVFSILSVTVGVT